MRPLKHLTLLDLGGNQIADLPAALACLGTLRGLRSLNLSGNACAGEPRYRARAVAALPATLEVLDFRRVTAAERREARSLVDSGGGGGGGAASAAAEPVVFGRRARQADVGPEAAWRARAPALTAAETRLKQAAAAARAARLEAAARADAAALASAADAAFWGRRGDRLPPPADVAAALAAARAPDGPLGALWASVPGGAGGESATVITATTTTTVAATTTSNSNTTGSSSPQSGPRPAARYAPRDVFVLGVHSRRGGGTGSSCSGGGGRRGCSAGSGGSASTKGRSIHGVASSTRAAERRLAAAEAAAAAAASGPRCTAAAEAAASSGGGGVTIAHRTFGATWAVTRVPLRL